MLPNALTFGLFMFPVISFMAALAVAILLPKFDSQATRRKPQSRQTPHTQS